MAHMKAYYMIIVKDSKGRVVKRIRGKSKSFLIQWLEIVYDMFAVSTINITNIAGTEDAWSTGVIPYCNAPLGETEEGILVGSGTTTPTNTDNCLATQITHGTAAGQLQYQAQVLNLPGVVGANVDMILTRNFINGSGGTVTVREIGLAVGEGTSTPTTTTGRLIIRDVLPSPVSVLNGQTLTVQYTLRTTV